MIKIIVLTGGIGNQMFGYAYYLSQKLNYKYKFIEIDIHNCETHHNGFEIRKVFPDVGMKNENYYHTITMITSKLITKYAFSDFFENKNKAKWYNLFQIIFGFWQSEKHFKSIEKEVKSVFKFNLSILNLKSKHYLAEILERNSVSVHIRRGDYLKHDDLFGDICTINYYAKAISHLKNIKSNLYFYFFSDDIEWVKKNFKLENSLIIDFNRGVDSWQDMCLMSFCKHNIIANSTFSWWGAWLNNNPSKVVIAPKKWMNGKDNINIIPDAWVKL